MNFERNIFDQYYLSTDGYYFEYRKDKNNNSLWRATLYRRDNDEAIDDIMVSAGWGLPEKTHHQVINHFEVKLLAVK